MNTFSAIHTPQRQTAPASPGLKVFNCDFARCKHPLALVDNQNLRLYLDGICIERYTMFICLHNECGFENQWHPKKKEFQTTYPFAYQDVARWFAQYIPLAKYYPTLSNVPCFKCQKVLSYTDGSRFYVANAVIPHRVDFACLYCGEKGKWRPTLKPCPC